MWKRAKDWIGETLITANGTELKVVGHNGKSSNASRHAFYCKVCAQDAELFPGGVAQGRIHSITHKGATPCGCGRHPRWNEYQFLVRAKRVAIAKGLHVYGYAEPFKDAYTKLQAYCPDHGRTESLSLNSLVNSGQGCRLCYEKTVSDRAMSDEDLTKRYVSLCGYPKGTNIKRSDRITPGKGRRHVIVTCSKCSSDEFAAAGLCDGSFEVESAYLSAGQRSCRCGTTKRIPEEIRLHQVKGLLAESGQFFHGWRGEYRNTRTKMIAECPEHGTYYPSIQSLLAGSRCPACSFGGYSVNKPGHCYVLQSECGTLLKIGITNNPDQRIRELRRFTPFSFTVLIVKPLPGPQAPIVERMIKAKHEPARLSGFNGASEWLLSDRAIVAALGAA